MGLQWPGYWRNYVKQISASLQNMKTRQSAESLTPKSPREVIINSWDRHHGAPPEKAEEKQEGASFRKEKEN